MRIVNKEYFAQNIYLKDRENFSWVMRNRDCRSDLSKVSPRFLLHARILQPTLMYVMRLKAFLREDENADVERIRDLRYLCEASLAFPPSYKLDILTKDTFF